MEDFVIEDVGVIDFGNVNFDVDFSIDDTVPSTGVLFLSELSDDGGNTADLSVFFQGNIVELNTWAYAHDFGSGAWGIISVEA